MNELIFPTRRRLLQGGILFGTALFATPGLFAEQLFETPRMTAGPFYPDRLPLDQDNDLIIINNSITPAVGKITHLSGRILSRTGAPIRNATIEIWQCDANQVYLHSSDSDRKKQQQDANFQGFGKFTTDSTGGYRFRTIKPVPYPGRPSPHIHYRILVGGQDVLTSQIFIKGDENNRRDGVFNSVRDVKERELIQTEFKPMKDSKIGELTANFDIVIGHTPDERTIKQNPKN